MTKIEEKCLVDQKSNHSILCAPPFLLAMIGRGGDEQVKADVAQLNGWNSWWQVPRQTPASRRGIQRLT